MHLGIDFGTCFTSAAILTGSQFRYVRDQSGGNASLTFPSAVYLTPEGELLIGTVAKNTARRDPTRFREEFKRLLGSDTPCRLGDRSFLPQELITRLIAHLKAEAESSLQVGLNSVVLTVPASYDAYRRELMRKAGIDAGFPEEGVALLDEPEAAALYYDWQLQQQGYAMKEGAIVLVYDLGGGTFDAALMRKEGDHFRSIAPPVGEPNCGGIDFDQVIYREILKVAGEELKTLLAPENVSQPALRLRLMIGDYCREVKHWLSTQAVYDDVLPTASMEEFLLKQTDFSAKVAPYVAGTIALCNNLVSSAGCAWDQVTGILMVGGSTRIPAVKAQLSAAFGRPLWQVEDPQLAVCLGAAARTEQQRSGLGAEPNLKSQGGRNMALAPCPECGRSVSTKASACPQCGYPLNAAPTDQAAQKPAVRTKLILASGSADATVKLWDPSTGDLIDTLAGHTDYIHSIAFSPDGRLLASGSNDKTVKIWNAATGVLIRTLRGHINFVTAIAFSPDGKMLASGSADTSIKLWDASTGNLKQTISGFGHVVLCVAFSQDGKLLAGSSEDKTIRLWDSATGDYIQSLSDHDHAFIKSIDFSSDGGSLVSSANDATKIWDLTKGELIQTLSGYMCATFSPDSRLLAIGCSDKTINIWDIRANEVTQSFAGHSERDNHSLGIFERIAAGGFVNSLAFSPHGDRLFSGSTDKSIKIWDIPGDKLVHTLFGHEGSVTTVACASITL